MKSKTKRIILIVIAVYALFVVFVSSLFYYMRNNPTDQVAMTYLWNDTSFEAQYGEIVHIGRNVTNRTEKSQNTKKVPYIVETKTERILVFVELQRFENNWSAVSWTVKEVHSID